MRNNRRYVGRGIHTEFLPFGKIHYAHYRKSCLYTSCGKPANFAQVTDLLRIPATTSSPAEVDCKSCLNSRRYKKVIVKMFLEKLKQ